MIKGKLAKILKDNPKITEAYISFVVNANPKFKWNYDKEADCLFGMLVALEKQGVIKLV